MEPIEFFVEHKSIAVFAHVVSVFVGMGAAGLSDVLFNFYARDKVLSRREVGVLDTLSRTVWVALAVIILSGTAIFLSDPAVYLASAKFLIKMTVVAALTINGFVLARFVQPHLTRSFLKSPQKAPVRRLAFMCGAVSVVSWLSALMLGLLDSIPFSYATALSLYALTVLGGVVCALFIEKRSYGHL